MFTPQSPPLFSRSIHGLLSVRKVCGPSLQAHSTIFTFFLTACIDATPLCECKQCDHVSLSLFFTTKSNIEFCWFSRRPCRPLFCYLGPRDIMSAKSQWRLGSCDSMWGLGVVPASSSKSLSASEPF